MPLPWRHFRPASITAHFELSTMIGHARDVGLGRDQVQERVIASSESSMPSSMLTSMICAPPSTCWRATDSASS